MDQEKKKKMIGLLQLAHKARCVSLGYTSVMRDIQETKALLIFCGNRENNFARKKAPALQRNGVHVSFVFTEAELSAIFGRRKLALVALNDKNFAQGIAQLLANKR